MRSPNIVFSITCKDGFVNNYQNKLVEILEQIGRFGCFPNEANETGSSV